MVQEKEKSRPLPFVSVIVPTRNRKYLLRKCLLSLARQTYPKDSYEVIVIDDSSIDGTLETIDSLKRNFSRLRSIRVSKRSPGAARNAGISASKGEIIACTDDDCVVPRNWIASFVREFWNQRISMVGGSISNAVPGYLSNAAHLLNFSEWSSHGGKRLVRIVLSANAAYRRSALGKIRYPPFPAGQGYEDALFSYALFKEGRRILFCPSIEVRHLTWEEDYGLGKFFALQRRAARGFLRGGHVVHGWKGEMISKVHILAFLCPGAFFVLGRCVKTSRFLQFLYYSPLIFLGDLCKGATITFSKKKKKDKSLISSQERMVARRRE